MKFVYEISFLLILVCAIRKQVSDANFTCTASNLARRNILKRRPEIDTVSQTKKMQHNIGSITPTVWLLQHQHIFFFLI